MPLLLGVDGGVKLAVCCVASWVLAVDWAALALVCCLILAWWMVHLGAVR